MTVRNRLPLVLLTLALSAVTSVVTNAQRAVTTGPQNVPLTAAVPVDPRITVGTLPNGLRYYIRGQQAAAGPRRAAARRQRRLGARRRRPARARALRRAHGLQRHAPLSRSRTSSPSCSRRACGSARTSTPTPASTRRSTSCRFRPTTRRSSIGRCSILEDWAHAVSFDPDEIDKERGVILEEWRIGLGADARMLDAQLPVLLQGLALRRAPADRQARDHPHVPATIA